MASEVDLTNEWRLRLQTECSEHSSEVHEAIVRWLIGEHSEGFLESEALQLRVAQQGMNYRYQILRQRYLGTQPERAYRTLIYRLSSLFLIRSKVRTWISISRDRQRTVVDVLQEVIQELLQNDTYMRQQIGWIAQCTNNSRLRNALMLASVEEYCLRPIRNQPLLVYRLVNYLRRSQRGGITQVPTGDLVRLLAEEITTDAWEEVASDETENVLNLLDSQVVSKYEEAQAAKEQQELREAVVQELEAYLTEKIGSVAAQWLQLYLQGYSMQLIAQTLNMPIRQVYRLRERIHYHAVRVFASKTQQELVESWLGKVQEPDLHSTRETVQTEEDVQIAGNRILDDSGSQQIEAYLDEKPISATVELLEEIFREKDEKSISQATTSSTPRNQFPIELPLLNLFTQLKEVGFPLGIDEYFLALRALQKGFGTTHHEALAELCRTLWVKSKDEEHLFNYHFRQVTQEISSLTPSAPTETKQELLPNLPTSDGKLERQDEESSAEELPNPTPSRAISQELMEIEDEIQVAEAVQIVTSSDRKVLINRFTQSDEYFPVTRRQMKQSWRYLRRMVREGPPVEIDIEATISRFSQQGIPSDPVMVPGRTNRTELLLLLDYKGSMVPFHALSQRLAETAQRGGRLGEAGVFYFHNCPIQYLYRDPSRQQAELISNLLMKLRPERSVVLIFSDGGAARGGFNPDRLELTKQFLDRLKERVRYVTWLNPLSKERWDSTTAGEIAQRVPMFEMSRKGMDGAIDVLRGRNLQVVG